MRRLSSAFLLSLSFLMFAQAAHAQSFTGPIAGGTGGAGRAAADPSESAFLNPATAAYFQRYIFTGFYQMGEASPDSDFSSHAVQISDGTPGNLVPGALSYVHNSVDLPQNSAGNSGGSAGKLKQDDFQASIGGFVFQKFSMGLSVHHLIQEGGGAKDRQTNATVGALYTPTEWIGLALVGYDLIPASDSVTASRRLNPVYALGSNFLLTEAFHVRADLVKPTIGARDRMDAGVGFESYFNQFLAARLGMQFKETAGETNITAGLGYKGPRLSLDYSIQQDTRSGGATRHLVDLWMPL